MGALDVVSVVTVSGEARLVSDSDAVEEFTSDARKQSGFAAAVADTLGLERAQVQFAGVAGHGGGRLLSGATDLTVHFKVSTGTVPGHESTTGAQLAVDVMSGLKAHQTELEASLASQDLPVRVMEVGASTEFEVVPAPVVQESAADPGEGGPATQQPGAPGATSTNTESGGSVGVIGAAVGGVAGLVIVVAVVAVLVSRRRGQRASSQASEDSHETWDDVSPPSPSARSPRSPMHGADEEPEAL